MKKVVIIGAGIGGLATALRLKRRGCDVTVLEQADTPGGKLNEFRQTGFRFDAGPSLFTLPSLVQELLAEDAGRFTFHKLDRSCHYFWDDGTRFTAWADKKKLSDEIQKVFQVDPAPTLQHLKKSEFLYRYTAKLFMERSLHKIGSYLSKDVWDAFVRVHRLQLNESMDEVNRKRLNHPKLVQLFNRYATYNGSDPYRAPGVLNIIPHLEHNIGTFFPRGGMYQITQSIYQTAKAKGVKFHFNEGATRIEVNQKKVSFVESAKHRYPADIVVSNADVVPTYRYLMKDQEQPEKILSRERSSSALIFYWGIQREFPQLHLHNILFSDNYQQEFEHLFKGDHPFEDPTVYINITSKCQPKDAPSGMENWFVMINVPANTGQDWSKWIPVLRKAIIEKINKNLNTDIEPLIVTEHRLDPLSIESKTGSYQGALYGTSSNDKMAAFLRHPNFSSKIKGLYFCGGSVHPGGGIPLCLLSARIVDDLSAKAHE